MPRVMGDGIRTYYMSRRVEVPPLVAQAAYDAHSGNQNLVVESGEGRLEMCGPVRRFATDGWWPLRSQSGTLVAGRHRWPVELEVLPWSGERIELGLRPQSRVFRYFPPDSVTLAGLDLLDRLGASIVAWADEPLREWALAAAVSRVS